MYTLVQEFMCKWKMLCTHTCKQEQSYMLYISLKIFLCERMIIRLYMPLQRQVTCKFPQAHAFGWSPRKMERFWPQS
jgi:hypothetical protein